MQFTTKDEALQILTSDQNLYGQDISEKSSAKIFILYTKEEILKKLNTDNHLYEYYGYKEDQNIKFFIDIDYKVEKEYEIIFTSKEELLVNILNEIDKYICQGNHKKIILDSSNEDKYSYHIIYPELIFRDVSNIQRLMNDFMKITNNIYYQIIDISVYGNKCLRCINQSKKGKTTILKSVEEIKIEDTLLLNVNPNLDVLEYKRDEIVNTYKKDICIRISPEQAEELVEMLHEKRAEEYNAWISVMMMLKCENNDEYFNAFDKFSQKSEKYNSEMVLRKWNGYKSNPEKRIYTYNSLLHYAKEDDTKKYMEFINKHNIFTNRRKKIPEIPTVTIDKEYLLDNGEIGECEVSTIVNELINTNLKGVIIKSAYGTGKTTLLKEIVKNYERVLYISYRVSLSDNIYGLFQGEFKLYTEEIDADKLICQIDSIHKIPNLLKYQMIIMDEIESILNHFNASTFTDKFNKFEYLVETCRYPQIKLLCMDGDVDNRTYIFTSYVTEGSFKMIENVKKKNPKEFMFHKDIRKYDEELEKDLSEKKDICIICMSTNIAKSYYNKYKDSHRCILYTAQTGDKQKRMLANVNAIWPSFNIVIYTPVIEAGVDYNVEHFDKLYIVMSSNSTSQRGLFQMINRIRKIKQNTLHVYLNDIYAVTNNYRNRYTIEEVEAYYKTDTISDELNSEKHKVFRQIQMYNKLETLTKDKTCFLQIFIEMLSEKGHSYKILEETKRRLRLPNVNIDTITATLSITEKEYDELKQKQLERQTSEEDKHKIIKYIFEKTFKIKFDDKVVVEKFINNIEMVSNAKRIFGYKQPNSYSDITLEIITLLFGNIMKPDQTLTINRTKLESELEAINQIIQTNKISLELPKNMVINSTQKLLPTVKKMLYDHGCEIIISKKNKKINGKVITGCYYTLKVFDEIQDIIVPNITDEIKDDYIDDIEILFENTPQINTNENINVTTI